MGDVKLKGVIVKTAELILDIAENVGFVVKRIIQDRIRASRKYMTHISQNKLGLKWDRILELHKGSVRPNRQPIEW